MPLLNDAKSCYVGTQPITTIMAGSVQVWPKGPPLPFSDLKLYYKAPSAPSINQGYFIAWQVPVRPSNCSRATMYEYRYTRIESVYPDDSWVSWRAFGYNNCLSWMPRFGEFENNLITFLCGSPSVNTRKDYIKVQLRYLAEPVTTSAEYTFSLKDEDIYTYPTLPSDAMNDPCPETCP